MTKSRRERRHPGVLVVFIVSLSAIGVLWIILTIISPAEQALQLAESQLAMERSSKEIELNQQIRSLDESTYPGVRFIPAAAGFTDALYHNERYYIAGETGIAVFAEDGRLVRHISYLNGLPGLPVRDLEVFNGQIFAAAGPGLVQIERDQAAAYIPQGNPLQINSLLVHDSRLVAGTESGRLLSFSADGRLIDEHSQIPGVPTAPVVDLETWQGRLVVATRDDGVYVLSGNQFTRIGTEQGLPVEVISSLAADGETLLIATMAGLVRMSDESAGTVVPATGLISALHSVNGDLYAGSHDGAFYQISGSRRLLLEAAPAIHPAGITAITGAPGGMLVLWEDRAGIFDGDLKFPFAAEMENFLSAPYINALVSGPGPSLWVGYFDRGVDIYGADMQKQERLFDDAVRYIKCGYYDVLTGAVLIGTSKGLHHYNADGSHHTTTVEDGLISNEVNHITRINDTTMAAATGSGLSFMRESGIESINAFHGLISNKCLSLCATPAIDGSGSQLLTGTLGGLSVVDEELNIANYSPDTSALPAHWVSAMAETGGMIAIGTYGKGIAFFDTASGTFYPQELPEDLHINPLAMLSAEEKLFAGSLNRGLLIYNEATNTWTRLTNVLPTMNITALAMRGGSLFVGTERGLVILEAGSLN